MIEESSLYGLKTVTLSNDVLKVRILPGKGGDINQITLSFRGISLLHVKEANFRRYENRNLYESPLAHYSEDDTGGWQDVIPGFGRYGEKAITQAPLGIAATVGWNVSAGKEGDADAVFLSVDLPDFPLHLEKRIWLDRNGINLEETVRNAGDRSADVTWTQHAMFGGSLLDENTDISYPDDEILLSALWAKQGGPMENFLFRTDNVPMPDGARHDLRKMRARAQDGILVFTMKAREGKCELYNEQKGVGVRLLWDEMLFPYLRCCYQNTKDAYAMGLEPCNYFYSSFAETDRDQMYLHLESGEEKTTRMRLEVF